MQAGRRQAGSEGGGRQRGRGTEEAGSWHAGNEHTKETNYVCLPHRRRAIQGCSKRWAPGCVKLGEKVVFQGEWINARTVSRC